ncbi:D-alanyl-D-alanine carboxypeptidase [Vannielia litorea]|uniref:D-alanyl-D-alanine carboxypeptidase family protein n=1 Tax=Vannielia litorea TaxID=1217970 RepID=UPI001C97B054|nr:D-alanyl-D-alanine carboxypeptidase family protein [Vannielia litorea]MBY6047892.1 D-alanyl-D-alanine carboxypeptidase [Vannielia litorea]MBY6075306.1 D-alanyl-D-alanine carboxypeptidase [Vannielia litorea]MBY6152207.1 D-alanyl-D-alanine carboxypeptidase [Vannielia litorea]
MLRLHGLATLIAAAVIAAATTAAAAFETRATSAWVVDETTGTILLSKNADTALPPASMSKLMTLNMLFEALRDGRVTLDTTFTVSERAKNMGGSSMFLNTTDRPSVEQLIQGIVVQSGNDACVVVAEGLAGTEDGFARLMNERARDLGMENSTFANASGWPNPGQRMSMHDLGILALRLIREFPEYYGYFGMEKFEFDGRVPTNHNNRNPLLKLGIGADGLKTGHTTEAGYGLVGSAKQGNRRIVFVITGLPSEDARKQEAINIVNWAFRQFVQKTVADEGTRIAEAPVWMGAEPRVGLVLANDLDVLMPALAQDRLEAEVSYEGPLRAPVAAGDEVASLTVTLPDMEAITVPLVAERDIPKGGFLPRIKTAAGVLMKQFAGQAAPQ